MAEYIDRQDLIKFLDNIQQPKIPITDGFKYITIDEAIRVVSERPTANVIEREKVKEAREKIWKNVYEYSGTGDEVLEAYKKGFQYSLKIIDELIESEEK